MERWVDFHGTFINMAHVSEIKVEERNDGYSNLFVCWSWSVDRGDGGFTPSENLVFGDHDKMVEEAHAIIRGDYDVPMGAEPTHAQASASVDRDDNKFHIDEEVDVRDGASGRVVMKSYNNHTKNWEYQIRYNSDESEWVEEERLIGSIPF